MIPQSYRQGKILDWKWLSGKDTVGVVAVETKLGEWVAYIGVSQEGNQEIDDARYIADWGAKLSTTEAFAFFPYLSPDAYKYK